MNEATIQVESVASPKSTLPNLRDLPDRAIDGRRAGSEVHRLLGDLFRSGNREIGPIELRRAVARSPLVARAELVYRQAAKQRLLTAAAVYLRFFAPERAWKLLAAELNVGGARADLVWDIAGSGVLIDEIKSGAVLAHFERDSLEDQVSRLLEGGRRKFAGRLLGVRAIVLHSPTSSFVARPDGSREPVRWEAA